MSVPDARRLKQLEEENARLTRLVAEQVLDVSVLKDHLPSPVERGLVAPPVLPRAAFR